MSWRGHEIPELPRLSDYVYLHAERNPQRVAAVFGRWRLTYAEAAQRVRALSRTLLAAGVRPGDRVATLCTPRPEFMIAYLATIDIGAIWVGLNPKYRRSELLHIVDDSQPRVIIGLTDFAGRDYRDDLGVLADRPFVERLITIDGAMTGADRLDEMFAAGDELEDLQRASAREEAGGRRPALIVYTSGTTGAPKGALITHKGLVWCFLRQWNRWQLDPLRLVCNLPINHIGCAGDLVGTSMVGGGTLVCMERFDPRAVLEAIPREQINVLFQVPTMLQLIAAQPAFEETDLSPVEILTWGGAAIPRAVLEAFADRMSGWQEVMYGQTEGTGTITYTDPGASVEQLTETIGHPDPELEVRIADAEGRPLPLGEEGEIQVRHETVFAGYYNRDDATAAAFTADGYLRTGDLAVERPDGYYRICGRLREMYKSGGYNVYPREVELCLEQHEAVAIASVVSVPDPIYDEVGHAFVVAKRDAQLDASELAAWCAARLANYKVPKQIRLMASLPTLPVGKVDKRTLRQSIIDQAGDADAAVFAREPERAGQPSRRSS